MGESGSDLSLTAARVAKECHLSIRSTPGWTVPRYRNGSPADLATSRLLWGLPRCAGHILSKIMVASDKNLDPDAVIRRTAELNAQVIEDTEKNRGVYATFGTKNSSYVTAMVDFGASLHPDIATGL